MVYCTLHFSKSVFKHWNWCSRSHLFILHCLLKLALVFKVKNVKVKICHFFLVFFLAHTQTIQGAWHISLSPVFEQLSCDTPSVSWTAIRAPPVQSHVRGLCLVLGYTGSVRMERCNTCGGKWPSGFSGPRAHGWQFTTFLVQTTPETAEE